MQFFKHSDFHFEYLLGLTRWFYLERNLFFGDQIQAFVDFTETAAADFANLRLLNWLRMEVRLIKFLFVVFLIPSITAFWNFGDFFFINVSRHLDLCLIFINFRGEFSWFFFLHFRFYFILHDLIFTHVFKIRIFISSYLTIHFFFFDVNLRYIISFFLFFFKVFFFL